jgi:phage terminase large subunit-like protein
MDEKGLVLTKSQKQKALEYVQKILEDLPSIAVSELLEGYGNDQDKLIGEIFNQVNDVLGFGMTLDSERLEFLSNLESSMDKTLKKLNYNYFKTTCLPNFNQNIRNLEWGNLAMLYPYLGLMAQRSSGKSFEVCVALPIWKLYSYDRPSNLIPDTIDNKNRKETLLITNTQTLGQEHISKIVEEIKFNDIISEKLNPTGKASLNATGIITETGSKLHLRGVTGFFRGLHTGTVICDDMPDESSIYSQEQRGKLKDLFYGGITPIVEPFGNLIVAGTPFHTADIYADIKKDKRFKVFEYPAIFPDGSILAPDRFTFDKLMEEKESLGTLRFAREYLVVPISDDATIFPYDYLKRAAIGMEHISYVDNVESFPIKMKRIVVGCDFALSGDVGSDYTVYTVWGKDFQDNYYLLHVWRKRGASYVEQINQIVSLDQRFKPNKIVCEANGFQKNLSTMAKDRGLRNIEEFNTTSFNKKNWEDGLPSLSALYERGSIKMPYKDGYSKEMSDIIFGEFNSIGVTDKGKLESNGGHDDTAMSCLFAIQDLRENKTEFRFDMV